MKSLVLYKMLMRESQKIPAYNFREYALRRVRDAFKESKGLTDSVAIKAQMDYGQQNLEIIKRQAIVGELYKTTKLVIEQKLVEVRLRPAIF